MTKCVSKYKCLNFLESSKETFDFFRGQIYFCIYFVFLKDLETFFFQIQIWQKKSRPCFPKKYFFALKEDILIFSHISKLGRWFSFLNVGHTTLIIDLTLIRAIKNVYTWTLIPQD